MGADGRVVFEIDADTKAFDEQIASLEWKLNDLMADYEAFSKEEGFNEQSKQAIQLRQEIEKTSNQIINLRKQQAKMEQTSGKSWGKVLKNVERVGMRMLGIASIYGIMSKASSAYLSKDTELAEKLQSVWTALGSYLAPVIEGFSNLMLKAVGYLNTFITALTGVDYIARANAKAIEKQAKATRDLNKANKQTYDFDVVRTQQEASSGGASTTSGLIEIPELNQSVVDKLKKLAEWLKENKELIKEVGIALVATFGAIAVAKILGGISALIGSGALVTGLSGLAYLLGILASIVLITIIIKGIDEAIQKTKELNSALHKETDVVESNTDSIKNMTQAYWEHEKQEGKNEEMDKLFADSLGKTSRGIQEEIDKLEEQKKKSWYSREAVQNLTNTQMVYAKQLGIVNGNYKLLFDQGKLNDDQKKDYAESLKKEIELTQGLGWDVENLKKQYEKIDGQTYTSKLELDTSQPEKKIGLLGHLWNGITGSIGQAWGGLKDVWWSIKDLFSSKTYATGGIVTQPTRAIIGEAGYPEAVVPMTQDYLSTLASEIARAGGGGNGTTNVYLDGRLIQRQIQNRENEIRFSVNK